VISLKRNKIAHLNKTVADLTARRDALTAEKTTLTAAGREKSDERTLSLHDLSVKRKVSMDFYYYNMFFLLFFVCCLRQR
jgi:hypothetical protein